MAFREIENRYVGSFGGLAWSIINPLMMILVYWFVFSVGFKIQPPGGFPFILVFLCGLIPWTLFSDTLIANANVISVNSHLVTKMVFPTEILPIVNLVASFVTHGIMLVILGIAMSFSGVSFSLINFQFLYYFFALSVFIVSLSWVLSAVNVFYRDMGQILSVLLNLWFWMTPIVWMADMVPERVLYFLNLNPMLYIVSGYRNSFLYNTPFWVQAKSGVYFWSLTIVLFILGGVIFRKLQREFAEVL